MRSIKARRVDGGTLVLTELGSRSPATAAKQSNVLEFSDESLNKSREVTVRKFIEGSGPEDQTWLAISDHSEHRVQVIVTERAVNKATGEITVPKFTGEGEISSLFEISYITCTCPHGRNANGKAHCYHVAAVMQHEFFEEKQLTHGIRLGV